MSTVVFLDTSILGYLTHPKGSVEATQCTGWMLSLLLAGNRICIPEVCDYELRREYLRRRNQKGLGKLDALKASIVYVPLSTKSMNHAAELWAKTRQNGRATADPKELDGDVILAAQALLEQSRTETLVIATTNVGHLSNFADARNWRDI